MKKTTLGIITISTLLLSPIASAHVGSFHIHNSLLDGLIHPFTGLDHLTMLMAIGVMAQHLKETKKSILMMATTIALMLSGLALGSIFSGAPSVEGLITGSLFIAAFSLWSQARTGNDIKKLLLNIASVSFILMHGWAHGAEFTSSSLTYFGMGMTCSAIIIMSMGFYLSRFVPTKLLAKVTAVCGLIVTFA
ncbi:HupE/UreJ family protein [Psychromonas sp. CD1]|uniref:HupE/UreJ family protein n=1 Tax=Psychromonas sp. CD1 TaxID=1979839 RepID=UPI000B9AABA6|nr:HupE/UreJ family protein [Psychromonas sp. CD1]